MIQKEKWEHRSYNNLSSYNFARAHPKMNQEDYRPTPNQYVEYRKTGTF